MNASHSHIMNLNHLIVKYQGMSPVQRLENLYKDFDEKDVLFTSSMGTSSVVLLHLISKVNPNQKIHFIDTTYLFQETHDYKNKIADKFNLNIETISPEKWKNDFTRNDQTWKTDTDLCCSVNKVEPLNKVKKDYKVWVSGLMAFQTKFRSSLDVFEKTDAILKFYPVIDVSPVFVKTYFERNKLPIHPLLAKGYASVGCTHCTVKGENRNGRWINSKKTECGLHYSKKD